MSTSNKEYQKQKKIWYKKLADSGFNDIEQSEERFKGDGSSKFARKRYVADIETRAAYYQMATHFLNEHDFDDKLDRIIWEYYTNGISYRNISKLLKKARVSKIGRNGIFRRVKALIAIMKRRYLNE